MITPCSRRIHSTMLLLKPSVAVAVQVPALAPVTVTVKDGPGLPTERALQSGWSRCTGVDATAIVPVYEVSLNVAVCAVSPSAGTRPLGVTVRLPDGLGDGDGVGVGAWVWVWLWGVGVGVAEGDGPWARCGVGARVMASATVTVLGDGVALGAGDGGAIRSAATPPPGNGAADALGAEVGSRSERATAIRGRRRGRGGRQV